MKNSVTMIFHDRELKRGTFGRGLFFVVEEEDEGGLCVR